MSLVDTHCHIHMDDYELDAEQAISTASDFGVTRLICVGTDANDSKQAVKFVHDKENCWASVGLHPHDSKLGQAELNILTELAGRPKVVAIGECGLDYFYNHSPRDQQKSALKFQIELALKHGLPMIFHVREAFADFWPIFDEYEGLTGVIHSFSATTIELDEILSRSLYVGLNGIMTFTKDQRQLEAAKAVPLDRLVIETDAPFLTPAPHRGKINQPRFLTYTVEFLANLRQEEPAVIARQTTDNAIKLFNLK